MSEPIERGPPESVGGPRTILLDDDLIRALLEPSQSAWREIEEDDRYEEEAPGDDPIGLTLSDWRLMSEEPRRGRSRFRPGHCRLLEQASQVPWGLFNAVFESIRHRFRCRQKDASTLLANASSLYYRLSSGTAPEVSDRRHSGPVVARCCTAMAEERLIRNVRLQDAEDLLLGAKIRWAQGDLEGVVSRMETEARVMFRGGEEFLGRSRLNEALDLAREIGIPGREAQTLLIITEPYTGERLADAVPYLEEALGSLERGQALELRLKLLNRLAAVELGLGRPDRARELLDQAEPLYYCFWNRRLLYEKLWCEAYLAGLSGNLDEEERKLLRLWEATDNSPMTSLRILAGLAENYWRRGKSLSLLASHPDIRDHLIMQFDLRDLFDDYEHKQPN